MKSKANTNHMIQGANRVVALVALILTATASLWAGETTLFTFHGNDGSSPTGNMVIDAAGNLYGVTTTGGGNANCSGNTCGVVFKLTPSSSGHWTETVLHRFTGGSDGDFPNFLIMDSAGNLYGTTNGGGGSSCSNGVGCGVVFKLAARPTGPWPETTLYRFSGGDGANPNGLAFDSLGNLYGTAANGGGGTASCAAVDGTGCGVLFQLTPTSSGSWTLTTLHTFLDFLTDAQGPTGLIFGPGGTIYGSSFAGGSNGWGTVFQLVPGAGGWTFSLIHSFGGPGDGIFPSSGLIVDAAGNLYGTTPSGGSGKAGIVFELSPGSGGTWTENILYNFHLGAGGYQPQSSLAFDAAGDLYGTTYYGGGIQCTNGCGTTYKLTPSGSGTWTQSVVFHFIYTNGAHPAGGLVRDAAGNFYGTAVIGGGAGYGVVFKFVP